MTRALTYRAPVGLLAVKIMDIISHRTVLFYFQARVLFQYLLGYVPGIPDDLFKSRRVGFPALPRQTLSSSEDAQRSAPVLENLKDRS